jgi:hypothetical protein
MFFQRLGRAETIITDEQVEKLEELICPGDILLSYEHQRSTSLAIKGFYKHAVMVGPNREVIGAVGNCFKRKKEAKWLFLWGDWIRNDDGTRKNFGGVKVDKLRGWLYKKDYVAAVRTKLPKKIREGAAANALIYVGLGYDYTFTHDNETIYCSELPYLCYRTEWPQFLAEIDEDKEILPQQYLDMCAHIHYLEKVVDTREMRF